jgi:hypothetical protein
MSSQLIDRQSSGCARRLPVRGWQEFVVAVVSLNSPRLALPPLYRTDSGMSEAHLRTLDQSDFNGRVVGRRTS